MSNWLQKISEFEPWKRTREQLRSRYTGKPGDNSGDLLFHGTTEPIEDFENPQIGGRGILWVAENPTIAQNYISPTGGYSVFHKPWGSENDIFRPDGDIGKKLLEMMGYKVSIEYDKSGRRTSWGIIDTPYENWPKNKDVIDYIENVLGYKLYRDYGIYKIKIVDNKVVPSNYHQPALLFMLAGKEKLKVYDMTKGGQIQGDLMDLQYNELDKFKQLEKAGYDAVRINDFAHNSENWGNVGHISLGLFPSGVKKLKIYHTPAKHFDWGDRLNVFDTDEFITWHKNQVEQAIKEGKPIPDEVLKQYGFKD